MKKAKKPVSTKKRKVKSIFLKNKRFGREFKMKKNECYRRAIISLSEILGRDSWQCKYWRDRNIKFCSILILANISGVEKSAPTWIEKQGFSPKSYDDAFVEAYLMWRQDIRALK